MHKIVFKEPSLSIDSYLKQIRSNPSFSPCPKFKSHGRFIHLQGHIMGHANYAPRYQIIQKMERTLTLKERLLRILKAIFLLITKPKIYHHHRKIQKLLWHKKEAIHYAIPVSTEPFIKDVNLHTPQQRHLSESLFKVRLSIGSTITLELANIFDCILNKDETCGLSFFQSQPTHRIFCLKKYPSLIFKINIDENSKHPIKDRYEKALEAETILRVFQLSHLKVPACQMIPLKIDERSYDVLVEEKLIFDSSYSFQKKAFTLLDQDTEQAVAQLALFICKSGYSDVEYRNNPILDYTLYPSCQIGLIDLEHLESTVWGLFGMNRKKHGIERKGLIGLCSQLVQDKVFKIAKDHGLFGDIDEKSVFSYTNKSHFECYIEACQKQTEEIALHRNLCDFYKISKITSAKQSIKKTKHLSHHFIESFLPFYPLKDQELYASRIIKIIDDYLKNTDESLPLDLARLVPLELSGASMEFKLFCHSLLKKLKEEGCIFSFKQDPTSSNCLLVQC